jgi:hypothetical protein
MTPRVHLECSPEQAAILCRALDLYMRVGGLGQFGEVADHWLMRAVTHERGFARSDLERPLRELHSMVMPSGIGGNLGASYGINSPDVPDEYRSATDIREVVRHALWRARPESERNGYTVDAHPARHWGALPLPTCEVTSPGNDAGAGLGSPHELGGASRASGAAHHCSARDTDVACAATLSERGRR